MELLISQKLKMLKVCQGTSIREQRRDRFGLRVKLPTVTTCLTN